MIESVHNYCVIWMISVIWLIQLVHYPIFHFIDRSRWSNFHRFHTFWITPVVAPAMVLQLGTSFFLDSGLRAWCVGLSVLVFAVTFGVSVPLHHQLQQEYREDLVRKLVVSNWLRTGIWSLHGLLLALQDFF